MTHTTNPSAQPVDDGELDKLIRRIAATGPTKEALTLSKSAFIRWRNRAVAQSYQSGYAAAVGDAVAVQPKRKGVDMTALRNGNTQAAANDAFNSALYHYRTAIEALGSKK